jgi:cytochrome c-type biogenesis protein CcmF
MSVPFSMICAALLAGRLESGWMAPIRRWMLIPWMFLTVGIILGGWWSYAVLGWGGAWAWDPVENASFHPWLTGTAFLHSAMVLQRRRWLLTWTLTLGMVTFLLTLFGTFLTRSGVFNSVHSFTQSDIGPVFLGFIFVSFSVSVILLAFRSHLLLDASQEADRRLGSLSTTRKHPLAIYFGRETAVVIQNALFTVWTFVVLQGTMWPLITEYLENRQTTVGQPYFDKWSLPIGLSLVFMMGIGPALPWGGADPERASQRLVRPLVGAAITAAIAYALGIDKPAALLALTTCGFALVANLNELFEPVTARMRARQESLPVAFARVWSRARRRFGGHLAHYGIILAVFGIALSKGYRVESDYTFDQNQTHTFGDVELTFTGARNEQEPQRMSQIATFALTTKGKALGLIEPRLNHYPRQQVVTPGVHSTLTRDIYLSILEVSNAQQQVTIRAIRNPYQVWVWWSAPLLMAGTLLALWPVGRKKDSSDTPPIASAEANG